MKMHQKKSYLKRHHLAGRYFALAIALATLLGNSYPVYAAQPEVPSEVAETAENADEAENTSEAESAGEAENTDNTLSKITSFKDLAPEVAEVFFDNKPDFETLTAEFPQTLSVFLNDTETETEISVTWSCEEDYGNTEYSSYKFVPSWDTQKYILATSLDSKKDVPYIKVTISSANASVFLMGIESAKKDLETLVKEKDILALVYLCDSYEVKEKAGKDSGTVATVTSGQSVQITGVDEDRNKNIWYQVSLDAQGNTYNGFIKRENLAYSDEEFINWEKNYVSIYMLRTFSSDSIIDSNASGVPLDISQFPSSYQEKLTALKNAHPNWIFVKMDTGINWTDAVTNENTKERSLIHSSVNAAWKKGSYDNNWSYPTDGILAHYMDPRNFLNDDYIFQYELLSYNETYHTDSAVQGILNNTFMSGGIPNDASGRSYSQAFCSIAKSYNVSPFHLASRVRQEQGDGKSALISGTYSGYEGLYNYFNIGATGKGNKEVIENGLKKAREYGWTNRFISLEGGSNTISRNYIQKGQDTLYLQKFNVNKNSPYGLYNHQYMQNIMAPSSESINVKKAYTSAGSINRPFVFRVPVYNNMPGSPCAKPTATKEVSLNKTSLTLKLNETYTLTAYIDGKQTASSSVTFTSSNANIVSVDASGVVKANSSGTATINCTTSGGSTAVCTVTVQKTDPEYTIPSLNGVTYSPSQKLKDITLPSGWTWDQPDTIPTVANSGYPATFTPSDTEKYNIIKKTLSLTVSKGTPAYTAPIGLQTVIGNSLASLKLPVGWTWDSPTTVLNKEGTITCKASYNPDPANYNTVAGIEVKVTVIAKSDECTTHSFGEWEHMTVATCSTEGKDTRSCHICGYKETKSLPALGHSYTAKVTKEATCTEKGVKTFTCACGDTYKEEIAALGHNYTSKVTKEATEKEDGIRTFTCGICNHTYTEVIPKLPASHKHSYVSKVTKEATCTGKGTKTFTCSCTDTYTEDISALGHDMADGKCKRCGYTEPKNDSGNNSSSNNNSGNSNTAQTQTNNQKDNTTTSVDKNTAPVDVSPKPSDTSGGGTGSSNNQVNKPSEKEETTAKNVTIDMKKNTVLYEEALSSIRGKDIDVVLSMGNSVSWTINGNDIVYDEANGIDMGVKVNAGIIPSDMLLKASGNNDNNPVIELSLAHDGPFDFSPILTINTAKDNAGRIANLFYFNPETTELEFVDDVEITDDGDITFTFSHASDYAVVISDESMAEIVSIGEEEQEVIPAINMDEPAPDSADTDESKAATLSPKTILIVVGIILLSAAIGALAFFILRPKSEEDFDGEDSDEDNEEEDFEVEDDFIDDYREPEVKIKTTGKVVSMKKTNNSSEIGRDEFDKDEFDGFE